MTTRNLPSILSNTLHQIMVVALAALSTFAADSRTKINGVSLD